MFLQVKRSKREGDLWGEIGQITFDGRELVIELSRTFEGDPRSGGKMKTGVELVNILPYRSGPVYTEHVAFATRDLKTGYDCYIRHPKITKQVAENKR